MYQPVGARRFQRRVDPLFERDEAHIHPREPDNSKKVRPSQREQPGDERSACNLRGHDRKQSRYRVSVTDEVEGDELDRYQKCRRNQKEEERGIGWKRGYQDFELSQDGEFPDSGGESREIIPQPVFEQDDRGRNYQKRSGDDPLYSPASRTAIVVSSVLQNFKTDLKSSGSLASQGYAIESEQVQSRPCDSD